MLLKIHNVGVWDSLLLGFEFVCVYLDVIQCVMNSLPHSNKVSSDIKWSDGLVFFILD